MNNPYVSDSDNFLVSDCCKAEAMYRVRKDSFDLVPWCPECLETYPLEWKEVNQEQYDEIINDQENKHLYDEMSEHYEEHGLPVKCNEEHRQEKDYFIFLDKDNDSKWCFVDTRNGNMEFFETEKEADKHLKEYHEKEVRESDLDRQTEEEKKTLLGLPTSDYDEILDDDLDAFIDSVKYPTYKDVLTVLEWTEDDKSNGFYDGCFDDLLPWQFELSDFQQPDREIELLIDLWNGNLDEENVVRGCLGNGGYIYYVEAHALLYEIVISPNMGIDAVSIIATEEEVE